MIFLSKEKEEDWNNAPESVKKMSEYILSQNIAEVQRKIIQDMENKIKQEKTPKECPFCKQKASDYEWMFLEQKDIAAGYREHIQMLKKELEELRLKTVRNE